MSSNRHTLLLSASFEPVRVIDRKKLMSLMLRDSITVLETYEEPIISCRRKWEHPAVVSLKRSFTYRRRVRCTRRNILLRDNYTCQYCGTHAHELRHGVKSLTLDHVLPSSRGGRSNFDNLVTACKSCNWKKADLTPFEAYMDLKTDPCRPEPHPKYFCPVRDPSRAPAQWRNYLIT